MPKKTYISLGLKLGDPALGAVSSLVRELDRDDHRNKKLVPAEELIGVDLMLLGRPSSLEEEGKVLALTRDYGLTLFTAKRSSGEQILYPGDIVVIVLPDSLQTGLFDRWRIIG